MPKLPNYVSRQHHHLFGKAHGGAAQLARTARDWLKDMILADWNDTDYVAAFREFILNEAVKKEVAPPDMVKRVIVFATCS